MLDERPREYPRPSAPGPIVEKFHAMVRDGGDIVDVYDKLLLDLTFNSKPIITELTIIAGDQKEDREGIADVICYRILEVAVDQKLPSLYLLDSIVKNIGCEYVRYFSSRLPKVFCEAYNQVNSNSHPAMRHLFGTWSKVFHPSVLHKIEDELHFSTTEKRSSGLAYMRNSESASPCPSHGIHVNPKYLEARRQLQHSTAMAAIDSQNAAQGSDFEKDEIDRLTPESPEGWSGTSPKFHARLQDVEQATGNSCTTHGYRQKSSIQYDDYDHSDVLHPRLGKAGSPCTLMVRASSMTGDEEPNHLLKVKISNPLSCSGLRQRSASPLDDKCPRENSPLRAAEMASPPHSRLDFGPSRAINQNGRVERSWPSGVGTEQLGASKAYDSSNGYSKKRLRELIDAYGNYGGKSTSLEHPPKLRRSYVNGMDRDILTKNWQSSEEEEYVWEDMSPTFADQNRRNSLLPFGPTSGSLSRRVALSRPEATILEPDFSRNSWAGQNRRHPVDDPPIVADDKMHVLGPGHASINKKFPDGTGSLFHHYHHSQEPEKFSYAYQQELNARSQGWGLPVPLPSSAVTLTSLNDQKVHSPYDYSPDIEMPLQRLSSIHSDPSNVETCLIDKHMAIRPLSTPTGPAILLPLNKSQPLPSFSVPPNQQHLKSPFSFMEVSAQMVNRGPKSSMILSQQQFDAADRKVLISRKMIPLPHQHPGSILMDQRSEEQSIDMASQSPEAHGGYVPSVPAHVSSQTSAPPINHIKNHEKGIVKGSVLLNSSAMAISVATHGVPDAWSIQHGGVFPPLPPGPSPASSLMEPASQSTGSAADAFPGLINTLMAQGLISFKPPVQSEGFMGIEFNTELLKVRHESAIIALYADLPRQCTTCGMRFTCQEEHRSHMDWHVTKNRVSRNHKQNSSRKWFVNAKDWLSGAETVGTDVVPGFMPTETLVEQQEEKEMAVPADENQALCALCGEPFEDFYSDEDEEWMYRGAVYLNAPDGHTKSLDRSQLGPIVHAKCRPDSSEGS